MFSASRRFRYFAACLASLGFSAVTATVTHAQQDLYVSSYQGGTISRFAGIGAGLFATTATTLSSPSLAGAEGLVFDKRGDLFAASLNGNNITEFSAGAAPGTFGATTAITGGPSSPNALTGPDGLAFDTHGDLFVSNVRGGSIAEFAPGVSPGTFAAPVVSPFFLPDPDGLAFDSRGDLFVASAQDNTVTELFPGAAPGGFDTAITLSDSSLNRPNRLAFDRYGNLFVSNSGNSTISELTVGPTPGTYGATETLYDPNLNSPNGLAFDGRGNLYVTSSLNGTITKFAATGAGTFGTGEVIESGLLTPSYLTFSPVTFSSTSAAVPEASTTVSLGLLLMLGLGTVLAVKKKATAA